MTESSIILAMKTVHVTSDAKARPTITAFTMMSADMNIDHGDNSRSATVVDFNGLLPLSAGVAVASGVKAAGADGATPDGTGNCAVGEAWAIKCENKTAWGAGRLGGVTTIMAPASASTAQMAQSSVSRPSGASSEEVFKGAARDASARKVQFTACVAAPLAAACSTNWLASAGAACALLAWKCPNDSRNWTASAKSASREPRLMFDRNHFMSACASAGDHSM